MGWRGTAGTDGSSVFGKTIRGPRGHAQRRLERADHRGFYPVPGRRGPAELPGHRRHRDRLDPARNHQVEVAEIGRDVEREAVPRDPVARVDADRRDLATLGPDAGEAGISL